MINQEAPSEYIKSTRFYIEKLIGKDESDKLYSHFISDNSILNSNIEDMLVSGIRKKSAEMLYYAKCIKKTDLGLEQVKHSMSCYNILSHMGYYNVEHFVFIPLDRKNNPLSGPVTISVGGASGTVVDTKILFQKILVHRRVNSFIVAHNHPSGNCQPSESDIELTRKISSSAVLLDLKMLDHLIITENGYYSFADNGYV
jgi:DNA repair protein RadC